MPTIRSSKTSLALAVSSALMFFSTNALAAVPPPVSYVDNILVDGVATVIPADFSIEKPGHVLEIFPTNSLGHNHAIFLVTGSDVRFTGKQVSVRTGDASGHTINNSGTLTIKASDRLSILNGSNGSYSVRTNAGGNTVLSSNIIDITHVSSGNAITVYSVNTGKTTIGDSNTKEINITAKGSTGDYVMGVWSDGSGGVGGQTNLTAENVNISVSGSGEYVEGIHVGTNAIPASTRSNVTIDADNINIVAKHTGGGKSAGISVMSAGELHLNGNLHIKADRAVLTRGKDIIKINQSGEHTVKLDGDIEFAYSKPGSDTSIDGDVSIKLTDSDSYWNGRLLKSYVALSKSRFDGDVLKVTGFKLELSNGAQWTPAYVEQDDNDLSTAWIGDIDGQKVQAVNSMTMNDGIINISKEMGKNQLTIERLIGTGGTLNVELTKTDNGFTVPTLNILAVGEASSARVMSAREVSSSGTSVPEFRINAVGINADDEDAELALESLPLAINTNPDANTEEEQSTQGVILINTVPEGDVKGAITQTVAADGTAGSITQAANTKLQDFQGVNATALVLWRNEINHLTKRMGDLRANEGTYGAWARVYGGESKWGTDTVTFKSTTVQAGGDMKVNDWYLGGAFSYTDSSLDLSNGDGDGESYGLAVYATKLYESGLYTDIVARYGYLKNDIQSGNMGLSTKQNAFGLSGEVGWHFPFAGLGYVEPQFELTYGYVEGDKVTATNGVTIDQDAYQNLIARIGGRVGFDFPEKAGTFYAHASYNYDFMGDADATATKGNLRADLKEDLGGGWFSYGIGAQFALGKSANTYVELERTTGGDVETPWKFNIGARWNF